MVTGFDTLIAQTDKSTHDELYIKYLDQNFNASTLNIVALLTWIFCMFLVLILILYSAMTATVLTGDIEKNIQRPVLQHPVVN